MTNSEKFNFIKVVKEGKVKLNDEFIFLVGNSKD